MVRTVKSYICNSSLQGVVQVIVQKWSGRGARTRAVIFGAVGGIAEGFCLYWLYMGAWLELLLGLTCSFILDAPGLAMVELYGNCIFHEWVFFKKVMRERFYTYVQKLVENLTSPLIYGFWKLLTLYRASHYNSSVWHSPFIEIRLWRIMAINNMHFREYHLSGRMSFIK